MGVFDEAKISQDYLSPRVVPLVQTGRLGGETWDNNFVVFENLIKFCWEFVKL